VARVARTEGFSVGISFGYFLPTFFEAFAPHYGTRPDRPVPAQDAFAPQPEPVAIPPGVEPPFIPDDVVIPRVTPGGSAAGALGGIGAILIAGADLLVKIIEQRQLQQLGDIIFEQDVRIRDIVQKGLQKKLAQRAALEIEKRVQALLGAPETFEIPQAEPMRAPTQPRRPELFPATAPQEIVLNPLPQAVPDVFEPTVQPVPQRIGQPGTQPFPGTFDPVPFPLPTSPAPFLSPLPETPVRLPSRTNPLTPIEPVSVGSIPDTILGQVDAIFGEPVPSFEPLALAQAQPQPGTPTDKCAPVRCEEPDEEEPRLRCYKGLYREQRTSTDFTQWAEVDCNTGREL